MDVFIPYEEIGSFLSRAKIQKSMGKGLFPPLLAPQHPASLFTPALPKMQNISSTGPFQEDYGLTMTFAKTKMSSSARVLYEPRS